MSARLGSVDTFIVNRMSQRLGGDVVDGPVLKREPPRRGRPPRRPTLPRGKRTVLKPQRQPVASAGPPTGVGPCIGGLGVGLGYFFRASFMLTLWSAIGLPSA